MIDPNAITTVRVDQLAESPFGLTDNIPHEVGQVLKRGTIQDLVNLVSTAIGVGSGVGYLPISVTDGQQLPDVPSDPSFFLCGKGTFLNVNGYPDIVCTEKLNAIMSLPDHWEIAVEIPISVDITGVSSITSIPFVGSGQDYELPAGAVAVKGWINDGVQHKEKAGFESRLNTFTQSGTTTTFKKTIPTGARVNIDCYF